MTDHATEMAPDGYGSAFVIGDIVETVKGAKFWGRIVSFDDDPDSHPGATVMAVHPEFKGTKHVYPLRQLRRRAALEAAQPAADGFVLVPEEVWETAFACFAGFAGVARQNYDEMPGPWAEVFRFQCDGAALKRLGVPASAETERSGALWPPAGYDGPGGFDGPTGAE